MPDAAPNFQGYQRNCPYTLDPSSGGAWTAPDLAKARKLVTASGTKGQLITLASTPVFAAPTRYFASVLESLGYKTRIRTIKGTGSYFNFINDSAHKTQTGMTEWNADYPSASQWFVPQLSCASFLPHTSANSNLAEFCDKRIDAEIAHASALQNTNPEAAAKFWRMIDHDLVTAAPWVAFVNPRSLDVVSSRVSNYQYNPQWGALLDQIWVR